MLIGWKSSVLRALITELASVIDVTVLLLLPSRRHPRHAANTSTLAPHQFMVCLGRNRASEVVCDRICFRFRDNASNIPHAPWDQAPFNMLFIQNAQVHYIHWCITCQQLQRPLAQSLEFDNGVNQKLLHGAKSHLWLTCGWMSWTMEKYLRKFVLLDIPWSKTMQQGTEMSVTVWKCRGCCRLGWCG